jgi:hypothetical protein
VGASGITRLVLAIEVDSARAYVGNDTIAVTDSAFGRATHWGTTTLGAARWLTLRGQRGCAR